VLIKNKSYFLLFVIFLIAFFFRFFRLEQSLLLPAEIAAEYLEIRGYILNSQIPLIGPVSSHPWFHFGPLYYWLLTPLMTIFGFQPIIASYLGALTGSLLIFLNFFVVNKIFNQKVALVSSFLLSISPFAIEFSRKGYYHFYVLFPLYFIFYFLYKIWSGKQKFIFWLGISFGVILNFHLSPIALLPVVGFVLWHSRNQLKFKFLFRGLLGFILVQLPFLIHDSQNKFSMTSKIIMWIPYRVFGFFGLRQENNLNPHLFRENLLFSRQFLNESLSSNHQTFMLLVLFALTIFILINFKKAIRLKTKEEFGYFFLFGSLLLIFLELFIHGQPPKHYFLIGLPAIIVLYSLIFVKLGKILIGKFFVSLFLILILFSNIRYFLTSTSFWASCDGWSHCFLTQKKIAEVIINDSKGRNFNLARVGEFDYYEDNYAQSYKFALWLLDAKLVQEKVDLRYTIYEDPKMIAGNKKGNPPAGGLKVGNIYILKEEK